MSSSFAYRHSPVWAQELLISAKSSLRSTMREGRAFGAMAAEIHKSEWWSERRLRAFQSEKLQMIAQSAVSNVPYYRNKYRPLDLDFEKPEFPGSPGEAAFDRLSRCARTRQFIHLRGKAGTAVLGKPGR